jgi:hypothetical protein
MWQWWRNKQVYFHRKIKRNHSATRTDFKDVKRTEQVQDWLKFVNIMKTDVQVSVYKSRKFLNRQCAQTAPRRLWATEPVDATSYWSQNYSSSSAYVRERNGI